MPETSDSMMTRLGHECGKSSTCVALPDGCLSNGKCKAFARFVPANDQSVCKGLVMFEIFGEMSAGAGSGYVAVGISHDNKMVSTFR